MSKYKSGPAWLLPSSCFSSQSLHTLQGGRGEARGETTLGQLILGSGLGALLTLISKQYLGVHY